MRLLNRILPLWYASAVFLLATSFTFLGHDYPANWFQGEPYDLDVLLAQTHQSENFLKGPMPEGFLGGINFGRAGEFTFFPQISKTLGAFSPQDYGGFAHYQYLFNSAYFMVSLFCFYFLLLRRGINPTLAITLSLCFNFSPPILSDWSHLLLFRSRTLAAAAMLAADWAVDQSRFLTWILLGLILLFALGHSATAFWMIPTVGIWIALRLYFMSGTKLGLAKRWSGALLSGLIVFVGFAPRFATCYRFLKDSAFYSSLKTPGFYLQYFTFLNDRCFADFLNVLGPEAGSNYDALILAGGSLFLICGVIMIARKRPPAALPADEKTALVITIVGFGLSLVPLIPLRLVFHTRRGSPLQLRFPPVDAPPWVASFFHTSYRTWFLMGTLGFSLTVALFLKRWIHSNETTKIKFLAVIGAGGLYSFAVRLAHPASPDAWRANVLVAGILILLFFCSLKLSWPRRVAQGGLLALSLVWAFAAAHLYFDTEIDEPSLKAAERQQAAFEVMSPLVGGRYDYRVISTIKGQDNIAFYLQTRGAKGYPVRSVSRELFAFLSELGIVKSYMLPYFIEFDYEKMAASGISDLLGIRYWIHSPTDTKLAGEQTTTVIDLNTQYRTHPGAFPRIWSLTRWRSAGNLSESAAMVRQLAEQSQLDTEGVIQRGDLPEFIPSVRPLQSKTQVTKLARDFIDLQNTANGMVIIATNDLYDPLWRVYVDGNQTTPIHINGVFLGALSPPGIHRVTFVYQDSPPPLKEKSKSLARRK